MKIHQQLSGHRDMNKIVLIDKNDIEKEKAEQKAFSKSSKINYKRHIKIDNCYFEMRKGETKQQATERLTKTFKHSIL